MDKEEKGRGVLDFRERKYFRMTKDIVDKDTVLKRPTDIAVYAVLCMYADNVSMDSYPSLETIAEKSRCSVSTARRSMRALESAGYIEVRKRLDARGYQTSNQYVLLDVDLS